MTDRCTLAFKALSDETRQKILHFLRDGPLSVGEIVKRTSLAQPTVSHHLNLLKQAGILLTERRGKRIYYSLCCGLETLECCSTIFKLLGVNLSAAKRSRRAR